MLVGETSADQLSVWREEEKIAFISGGRGGERGGMGESGGRKQKLNQLYFFCEKKFTQGGGKNGTWRQESTATNDNSSDSKSSNQLHGILPLPKTRLTSSHFHAVQPGAETVFSRIIYILVFSRKRSKRVPAIVLLDSSINNYSLRTSTPFTLPPSQPPRITFNPSPYPPPPACCSCLLLMDKNYGI